MDQHIQHVECRVTGLINTDTDHATDTKLFMSNIIIDSTLGKLS